MKRDLDRLKASVSLRDLLAGDGLTLRRQSGEEYAGPCPWCGGEDRFHAQYAEGWWFCRQCSPQRGDAIGYLMRRDGRSFVEVLDALDPSPRSLFATPVRPRAQPATVPTTVAAASAPREGVPDMTFTPLAAAAPPAIPEPSAEWRASAETVVAEAVRRLWGTEGGASARAYLAARGLSEETLRLAELGYVPRDETVAGLQVPAGVLIPWRDTAGALWQLKLRRRKGLEPRYLAVAGGHPYLYAPTGLGSVRSAVVLTEGEFDALLVGQELRDHAPTMATAATLGSASAGLAGLDPALRRLLSVRTPLLVAYDADAPGEKAAAAVAAQLANAAILTLPRGDWKDWTEYVRAGGLVRELVEDALVRYRYPPIEDDVPGRCLRPQCVGVPYLAWDDELDLGFCARHKERWQLVSKAELAGWPPVDGVALGKSGWLRAAVHLPDEELGRYADLALAALEAVS